MDVTVELPKSMYTLAIVNTLYGINKDENYINALNVICYIFSFLVIVIQAIILSQLSHLVFQDFQYCLEVGTMHADHRQDHGHHVQDNDLYVRWAVLCVALFAMIPSLNDFLIDSYLVLYPSRVIIEFSDGSTQPRVMTRGPSLSWQILAGFFALWELLVWLAVLLIGCQYILEQKQIGDLVQAAMAMNFINDLDNFAFSFVLSPDIVVFKAIIAQSFKKKLFRTHVYACLPTVAILFFLMTTLHCVAVPAVETSQNNRNNSQGSEL